MKPIRFTLSMLIASLVCLTGIIHLERGESMGALVMAIVAFGVVVQAVIHATLVD